MRTRQKRRILPDTMIQEIGRSVKCQKLNKFISRTPKLSVNKPNPLRGDQFRPPDESFSKSVPQSGTPQLFTLPYSLFSFHSPRLAAYRTPANPLTSRERQRIAPRRGGGISFARRTKVSPNPCRKAHRSYSLFSIHYSLPTRPAWRHTAPRQTHPTSRDCQGIAPRRGFPISWGYDKISAGAVGARFYTNKSGAKENHLCRELWVWPGRPLQNMI